MSRVLGLSSTISLRLQRGLCVAALGAMVFGCVEQAEEKPTKEDEEFVKKNLLSSEPTPQFSVRADLDACRQKTEGLELALAEARAQLSERNAAPVAFGLAGAGAGKAARSRRRRSLPGDHDDLELVLGIGPVYARRLYEAGVLTFEALGDLEAERLVAIVQARKWQKVEPESWRQQARALADQKKALAG